MASTTDPQHDRVRVAFFPNIGHAIPIVGLENQIFSENLGDIPISPKTVWQRPAGDRVTVCKLD